MRFFPGPTLLLLAALLNFSPLMGADYYWVGGSGNWSDITHWVTSSGGTAQHSQVPTANDRVIFDANSFTAPGQVVTVNNQTIFCRDLIWENVTNNPRFEGPANFLLNIYGSLRLSPNMIFDFRGDINFLASDAGHDINTAGHLLRRRVNFAGAGGGWTLAGGLRVDSMLTLTDGNLNTAGHPVVCELLTVQPRTPLTLNLDSSRVTVTGIPYYIYAYADEQPVVELYAANLALQADRSTLELTAPTVYFRARNFGTLQFGTLLFSSTLGKSLLWIENPGTLTLRFRKLDLRNDTEVRGVAQFDDLVLGKGKNFVFEGGQVYNLGALTAQGECAAPIQLFSNTPGKPVTFQATSGAIQGNYLSLRDIHGAGGASFTANNSADLGNNTGWAINPKTSSALYWVGGSGMWNDPAHWSLTSGGPGGSCVPTAGDDVFFDDKSFPNPAGIVVINVDNAYCRSMNWTGATGRPQLRGTDEKNIHIFGSLTFIQNMTLDFAGDFFFEANKTGNTINTAGQVLKSDVTFNGGGDWTLLDSLVLIHDIQYQQGGLNTNGKKVICQIFNGNFQTNRRLTLGNTHWVLRQVENNNKNRYYVQWNLNSKNLIFDAGQSHIDFDWYGGFFNFGEEKMAYNVVSTNFSVDLFNPGLYNNLNELSEPVEFDTLITLAGAYFTRSHLANTWEVNEGFVYAIQPEDTLSVGQIIYPGECDGIVEIRCAVDDSTAYIEALQPIVVSNFVIKDVHRIGSGTITANQSVDLGNTKGWVINTSAGRNLYWVGGTGDWNDRDHWSLSSGGPGGECIPTPLDNVFFDANSFSGANQEARAYGVNYYCKNMTWEGAQFNPYFSMWILNCFGSIKMIPGMNVSFTTLALRSEIAGQTVTTAGKFINQVLFQGSGSWILQDTLAVNYLMHINGTFNSNDKPVDVGQNFHAEYNNNPKKLQLGASHWYLRGSTWYSFGVLDVDYVIEPGTSLLEFTSSSAWLFTASSVAFHNVLFSNIAGASKVETSPGAKIVTTLNRLEFRNDGTMLGAHVVDSLIFSPGKSYFLDVVERQIVKEYFQVIGNNCNPIELSSTRPGTKSIVEMNSGEIRGDFIQMRDQQGVGRVTFYAGVHSTNIGNSNVNWVFDSPEGYVDEGILGKDVVLCKGSAVKLDANTFSPGETYRWQDGSTNPVFTANRTGLYWVDIRYADNCTLRDSINVLSPADFQANLPGDTLLCEGEKLILDPGIELVGLTYLWQDSTNKRQFEVTAPGKYKVQLELSGCVSADSLQVRYQQNPKLDLGADIKLCNGEVTTLNATTAGATAYRWQDGTTTATYRVTQGGQYTATVFIGRCTGTDSITVNYEPPLALNLGRDTTICENAVLTLAPTVTGATFQWSDGSANASLRVGTPGLYWAEATRNGCKERDSILVRQQALPRFELGPDTALCEGQLLLLQASTLPGATFAWSTGPTTPTLNVTAAGTYSLTATLNGCTFSDQRKVDFKPLPVVNLGPDQTPCRGDQVRLDAALNGASYRWQNGSTQPQFTVRDDGLYWVELSLNGCLRRDSVAFTYKPLPQFNLGRDTTLCENQTLGLNGAVNGATYRWSTGATTPDLTVTTQGLYWLEATLNGCPQRDSIQVSYIFFPQNWLGADRVLCEGQVLDLDVSTPNATYRWQDGSTQPRFRVTSAGTYAVQVQVGACAEGDTLVLAYNPLPRFSLGRDTQTCKSNLLILQAIAGADSYRWQDGATTETKVASQTGLYWAEATLSGCSWRDSIQVEVQEPPALNLGPDTTICDDKKLELKSNVRTDGYLWQDGTSSQTIEVRQPGLYILTVTDGACQVTDSVLVNFRKCYYFKLYAPNAFSPNGDGVNDNFQTYTAEAITIQSYDLRIFDRWGTLVFQTTDPTQTWDGKYRGKNLPQGTYVYYAFIRYRDDKGEDEAEFSGDFLLVR